MAQYLEKSEQQAGRAYSPAVITEGGRTVWLAGQTATRDEAGNDIAGNFDAQVKTIFSLIDKTLRRTGGTLANLVTMTVFINDPRNGDRFVELRKGFFPDGNFPASALDHGVAFCPARHVDRNPGRGGDRRIAATGLAAANRAA